MNMTDLKPEPPPVENDEVVEPTPEDDPKVAHEPVVTPEENQP